MTLLYNKKKIFEIIVGLNKKLSADRYYARHPLKASDPVDKSDICYLCSMLDCCGISKSAISAGSNANRENILFSNS